MIKKNISEESGLKKVPFERNKKSFNLKKSQIIFNLILIKLCVIIVIIFFKYYLFKKNLQNQIQNYELRIKAKDNEIKIMRLELNNINQEKTITQKQNIIKQKKLSFLEREYLFDIEFYQKNNMASTEDLNKLAYSLIFLTHTLEKGLSHFDLRPFGQRKIHSIINILNKELKYENHQNHFSFINGINSLREYKRVYKENKWTEQEEYKIVSVFLKKYENIQKLKTGAYILTKE